MVGKNKISMFQAVLLFMVMVYSPLMRAPRFTIENAFEAAWLTPVVAAFGFVLLGLIIKSFVSRYPGKAMPDIICEIMGKPVGKVIVFVFLIWILILLALYVRYFSERLASSIYTSTNINVFAIIMLILVWFTLRSGIKVIARMNKIIFILLLLQFIFIMVFLIPKINIDYLTPITFSHIVPTFKGSIGLMGLWINLFYLFMISDQIKTNKRFKNNIIWSLIFMTVSTIILIVTVLGTFGVETMLKIPYPLLTAVKNISERGTTSGIDSLFISFWIFGDYITITCFAYIGINLMKSLFKLKNAFCLLSIELIFVCILAQFLANEFFELQFFSLGFAVYVNLITGLILPIIMYVIGRIRKKI